MESLARYLQSMRQKEDCEVAVEGICMFPEGAGMKGSHGVHLQLAPPHQASLYQ